jgi:multicomponent K+:H+ antiporter subunit E
MKAWLPAPSMSLALWLIWVLASDSAGAGQLLLGAVLAWLIPLVLRGHVGELPRVSRPLTALRLVLVVLRDIVVSNVEVARRVLGPERAIHPGFVEVPLDLASAHGIAVLAAIVTMTPGTLTCDVAPDRSHLLVHALHLTDEAALVADIKARYEAPLLEIFG